MNDVECFFSQEFLFLILPHHPRELRMQLLYNPEHHLRYLKNECVMMPINLVVLRWISPVLTADKNGSKYVQLTGFVGLTLKIMKQEIEVETFSIKIEKLFIAYLLQVCWMTTVRCDNS